MEEKENKINNETILDEVQTIGVWSIVSFFIILVVMAIGIITTKVKTSELNERFDTIEEKLGAIEGNIDNIFICPECGEKLVLETYEDKGYWDDYYAYFHCNKCGYKSSESASVIGLNEAIERAKEHYLETYSDR